MPHRITFHDKDLSESLHFILFLLILLVQIVFSSYSTFLNISVVTICKYIYLWVMPDCLDIIILGFFYV